MISFLVLRTSGRFSKREVLIFIARLSTSQFHTSGFFYRTSGHFFTRQLSHTSEPSRENGLKLKPHGYHTATTRNSSQTWKVVSVHFPVRGHNCLPRR